ncbi:MAG: 16S rRNA (adenine(1518)-N(6)/adenine(1519)-N(6))-dimethyltransferase RsmA [Clostridia bacterium]|nr:16S rRNA (adenine(1518)-N(6)/adenine(1519)-N(6))-dimethyltransferase RsmA [Clostridia bacterium]
MMNLCDLRTVREIMERHGLKFRHEFGQNFLITPAVPQRIAEMCCDDAESCILEIGPGIGTLTCYLAERFSKVTAVEIDRGLIPALGETLAEYGNVKIINDDIMKVDIEKLVREEFSDRRVSVCANLPYYITTPIIMKLLESNVRFDSITVMIQREVADRLTASAGDSDYGAITAVLGYYGEAEKLFTVKPGNFEPPPKVDSTVVRISLYDTPKYTPRDRELFFSVIKAAFAQRRKTMLNALSSGLSGYDKAMISRAIEEAGHRADIRGERLSTADFCLLSDKLYEIKNNIQEI